MPVSLNLLMNEQAVLNRLRKRFWVGCLTLHLLRVVYGWTVQVGGWVVPEAASVVGMIIAAGLCAWAFLLAHKQSSD